MSEDTTTPCESTMVDSDLDPAPAPSGTPAAESAGAAPEQTEPNPNREAANYRTKLRETEVERDGLRGRVEALLRREVEGIAAEHLAVPGDLFDVAGVQLADMLGTDGEIDADLVRVTAAAAVAQRPGMGKARPQWPGTKGQGNRPTSTQESSWQQVLGEPGRYSDG